MKSDSQPRKGPDDLTAVVVYESKSISQLAVISTKGFLLEYYEYTIIPKACEFFHGIVLFYLTHLWVEP